MSTTSVHEVFPASPVAPGWYRDPDEPRRHRYWTGERWQSQGERLAQQRPRQDSNLRPRD